MNRSREGALEFLELLQVRKAVRVENRKSHREGPGRCQEICLSYAHGAVRLQVLTVGDSSQLDCGNHRNKGDWVNLRGQQHSHRSKSPAPSSIT